MAFDLQEAKAVLPQVQNPAIRERLLSKIRQFEPGFGEQAAGLPGLESKLGAPQETEVTEVRGKPGAVAAPAPEAGGGTGGGGAEIPTGSGGAAAAGPSGEGGTGMAGNEPSPAEQLQRLEMDLEAEERAAAGAPKPPDTWNPQRPLTILDRIPVDMGGRLAYYIEPSREMFRAELSQRARELEKHARAAEDALRTQMGAMAPEAVMELSRVVQDYQKAVRDASEAGAIRQDSPAFREWQDQKFTEWLAQHQQNPEAGPVVRTDRAPTNTLWEKIGWGQQKAKEAIFSGGASLLESASAGLSTGPLDAVLGDEAADVLRASRDDSPVADTLGAVLGVMTPGSLSGRLATATARAAQPLGKALGGAAAGGVTAATEGAVSDLSHDFLGGAGPERFNTGEGPSEVDKLAARLGIGGTFGLAGGLLQRGASRKLRAQDREAAAFGRPSRAEGEAAGFRPKLTGGMNIPPEAEFVAEEAVRRGTTADDVLAGAAARPMAQRSAQNIGAKEAELQAFMKQVEGSRYMQNQRISAAPLVKVLNENLAGMRGASGGLLVGANERPLSQNFWRLLEPLSDKKHATIVPSGTPPVPRRRDILELQKKDWDASPLSRDERFRDIVVPDGHKIRLEPTKRSPIDIEDELRQIQGKLKPWGKAEPEGPEADTFRALDQAARQMRDKVKWSPTWAKQGFLPPVEEIDVAGQKQILRGYSAMMHRLSRGLGEAEDVATASGIRGRKPFRAMDFSEREQMLNTLKSYPAASEQSRALMRQLADEAGVTKYLQTMSGLRSAGQLDAGSMVPGATVGTTGPRGFVSPSPTARSNAFRALLLKVAAEDPGAPGALHSFLVLLRGPKGGRRQHVADNLPPREAFGLAPLRVGQGRLGAEAGAAYNAQQAREQRSSITPDMLLSEITEEDLQNLQRALAAFSGKETQQ